MITPRATRLLRAPDLRSLQRTLVQLVPRGQAARATAVVVPTRSAAEQLRRTMEVAALAAPSEVVFITPDLLTRDELYLHLYERLPQAPPLLNPFERDVLLRLAAEDAEREGHLAPFRLRPGLLAAMLGFYDELRRRGRTIDSLDRNVRLQLEAGRDTDRGAARLLAQTDFLSAAFAAFERRVGESGRIDEHALRALLVSVPLLHPYRHIIVGVADRAADGAGLWPADFDLISRLPGLERIDVVATERLLAAGWHQRVHDALPGLGEERTAPAEARPALLAPPAPGLSAPVPDARLHFVARDREEELVDAARWIKRRSREDTAGGPGVRALDRTAVVFGRPLPYLYLARQVFESARVPYQALDALPLASEPFAAALDLVFTAAAEDASRTAIVELLASPHWRIVDPMRPDAPLSRADVAALDGLLRHVKYLGGWERLADAVARIGTRGALATREGGMWRSAAPALRAAASLAPSLEPLRTASSASGQLAAALSFIAAHERPDHPSDTSPERHLRARAAVIGALASLRDAHRQFDDRPLPIGELVAAVRRWIEAQTFAPRRGREGILLLDARAAAFAAVDAVRVVGLVESDWPGPSSGNIFYPSGLLRDLGWSPDAERLTAERARFLDLLELATAETSVSTFTLEDDALVAPSAFLEELSGCGLTVERTDVGAADRVTTHEAVSTVPLVAEALEGDALHWLRARLARTPAADPRYHGSVGRQPPAVYAVSLVERYLECPFKYFASRVLQLNEEREDESGLTPQERGQLLHLVFERFFVRWTASGQGSITAANLDDAVAAFEEVAEEALLALPEGDRALERTYLLGSAASPGLAQRAFAFEIEQGVDVLERLLEHEFDGGFTFEAAEGPREVRLRGKADRIDLLADGTLRIVDYKLGRAPKPARALQLPVYGACAEQRLQGRHGRDWTVGRAGYLAFKEKNPFVDLGARTGGLAAAVREGQARFIKAVDGIERGAFPPDPDEAWTCNRCGFPHVCRKDYVGDE